MRIRILYISILLQLFSRVAFAQEYSNIDSLKLALYQESNPQNKIDFLIDLTDLLLSSDPDKAHDFATEAYELADQNNFTERKLQACLHLSEIYRNKTDFGNSMEMGNLAKSLATDLDMEKEYAESLLQIALNFSNLGDYNKSANLHFEALRIFEELGDEQGLGKVFNQIGSDYFHQENYDKALEYYRRSLNIARESKDLPGISRGLNNMAIVYAKQNEYRDVKLT
jgi:tetratricopeptide (TPR) repeat protein